MNENLHLSKWQHIYPKSLIRNFEDESHEVTIYNLKNKKKRKQKSYSLGEDFCVNRLWGEKAEKGWMKEIEDSFLGVCDKLSIDNFDRETYNQIITDFYVLWYLRSYTENNSCEKFKVLKAEDIEDHRNGVLNSSLIISFIINNMELIPFPSNLNNFEADHKPLRDIKNAKKTIAGNQFKNAKILMGVPKDNNHKKRLESNIPWNANKANRSKEGINEWNKREAIYYIDDEGYMPRRFINDFKIRKSFDIYSRRFHKLSWGILSADCGEFVVPRGINMTYIIPVSPSKAFIANSDNMNINCQDIKIINTSLLIDQSKFFCSNIENTMLFNDKCPLI